jgi:hypothetical protein
MPLFARWRAQRELQRRAGAYVEQLFGDPAAADVAWLAEAATDGDPDHARWELRYARRALGLLAAQRDALDDRTGSIVARQLGERMLRDADVAAEMRETAEVQFNARLSAYRDVLASRPGAPVALRLGQMLLAFAGGPIGLGREEVASAGELMSRYLAESNDALRDRFGAVALPEDVVPSALGQAG